MIEFLGQSPINSVATAGRSEFMSIFRNRPSNAFREDPNRYPRSYTSTRGILINKEFVDGVSVPDLSKGYYFQFNPSTITDVKRTLYSERQYAGLPYNDYIWGGGGERLISFQLFLDNTPQSKQRYFRPNVYGSTIAKEFKTEGTGYTFDEKSGKYSVRRSVDLGLISDVKSLTESALPSNGPSSFEYIDNGAYSTSRVHERGIMPEVELIQSFLYPAPLVGETTPRFAEGGIVSTQQFRPPAIAILAIGPLYLEGVIKSAPVTYTLFDQDLTPIRGTIDLEVAVLEYEEIERQIDFKPY